MAQLAGHTILLAGDSWIAGAAGRALAAALTAMGANVVAVDGIVGRTSIALAGDDNFKHELATLHPTDVVVVIGVNDTPGDRAAAAYVKLAQQITAAGARGWILSNATLEGSTYRTKVQQIEALQRAAFGSSAIAGSSFASSADFDSTHYHLTAAGAASWGPFVARIIADKLAPDIAMQFGRTLLRSLPGAEGFFGRFGG